MWNTNNQNGGLVFEAENKLYVSDVYTYKGLITVEETKVHKINDVMAWFINQDTNDKYLYYSNENKRNKLCRMNVEEKEENIITEDTIYLLTLYDNYLYYINQEDGKLYRCDKQGRYKEVVINDHVTSYMIADRKIWYGVESGIGTCNLEGFHKETLTKDTGTSIAYAEDALAFCNKNKNNCITVVDLIDAGQYDIDGSYATNISVYDNYLFFSHKKEQCAIYRYNLTNRDSIKFTSETAEYLHIIDKHIIFYDVYGTHDWMKVPISGGRAVPLYNKMEVKE